ncbi:hypothetical protein HAX54_015295, partial [Datura stramonium]|nr:hypothetical protein [Datura stramonium]
EESEEGWPLHAITIRSGRRLAETTPISTEQDEDLTSAIEHAAKDKVEKINLAKSAGPVVMEKNKGDEVKAKRKEV